MSMHPVLIGLAVAMWAGVHSWLASIGVKTFAGRALGEGPMRAYRLSYNAFSVLSLVPILIWMRTLPDRTLYSVQAPWLYAMLAGQVISAIFLFVALLQTNTLHFAGVSQLFGRNETTGLVSTGFYRLVRHPLYLFGLLILWLTPIITVNSFAVCAVLSAYIFVGARLEERRLVREFGALYTEYQARTPMIFPSLRVGRSTTTDSQTEGRAGG